MPTRKITRAWRRPGSRERPQIVSESASLIDFFHAMHRHNVPILPVSYQAGREILGGGLSGNIKQATADFATVLAFKQGVPLKRDTDDDQHQDWYSLVTEITVLRHPPIRDNHHIIDILGVAFSVDAETEAKKAWPLLVTRRANMGDVGSLLLNATRPLTDELRWQLFAGLIEAVYLLHACDVAHGDIKPSNFLIENTGAETNCELIDFGSSVIRGQDRLPTLNPPWNAPELCNVDHSLGFEYLVQADMFSLCLLCVHILLPLATLREAGLCLLREQQSDTEWEEVMTQLEQAKSPKPELDGLATRIIQTISKSTIPSDQKSLLVRLVRGTIIPPNGSRSIPWDDIFDVTKNHLPANFTMGDLSPVEPPPLANSSTLTGHDKHAAFQLGPLLGELDDTHFLVRQGVLCDLARKAEKSACEKCRQQYAFQLAICYRIGFGCLNDDNIGNYWLQKAQRSHASLDFAIDLVGKQYEGRHRVPKHTLEKLGIDILQTSDRTLEYEAFGQLSEAESSLRSEIQSRSAVFGNDHRVLTRLQSELVRILRMRHQDQEAAYFQERVVDITARAYGVDRPSSIIAKLTLADIWTDQGLLQKAVGVQEKYLPLLREVMGPEHPDVIAAMHLRATTMASKGDLSGAEQILREVIASRTKVLSPDHPLTTSAEYSLVIVLRAGEHLQKALELMESIEYKLTELLEGDQMMRKVQLYMFQAPLYNDMGLTDTAMKKIRTVHCLLGRMKFGDHNELRLKAYEVQASIHHSCLQLTEEEALLRKIMAGSGSKPPGSQISDTRIYVRLARNLLRQERHSEAYAVAEEVIQSLEPSPLIIDPYNYVDCVDITAKALLAQGKQEAAEERLMQAYQACWAERNPKRIAMMADLAYTYGMSGRLTEAMDLFCQIEELGHIDEQAQPIKSATLLGKRAGICFQLGRLADAEALDRRALSIRQRAYGADHNDVLATKSNLATTLKELSRYSEAATLLRGILEVQKRHIAEAKRGSASVLYLHMQRFAKTLKDLAGVLFFDDKLTTSLAVFRSALEVMTVGRGSSTAIADLKDSIQEVQKKMGQE